MSESSSPAKGRLYGPLLPGFGERIESAVNLLGGRRQAADVMDLSDDQVGKVINEKSAPNFAAIAALAKRTGVNLYWLAFGEAPQFANETLSTRKAFSGAEGSAATGDAKSDIVYLRGYGIGGGPELASVPFPRHYLEGVLKLDADDVAALEHSGDAMAPTIGDRDLVLLHLGRREIADGAILTLRLGGELLTKRIQRETDGAVQLISDNRNYGSIKIVPGAERQLEVIGRVIWKGGAL